MSTPTPNFTREELRTASYIAGAGCLATATILGLYPLLKYAVPARGDIIVEGKIGSSAAGNKASSAGHHPERSGVVRTYAATGHRHTAEIMQELPGNFPVHLTATAIERIRGILVTAHVFLPDGYSDRDVLGAYREAYEDEPFVRLVTAKRGIHRVPDPKILDGTNFCDVGFEVDNEFGARGGHERPRQSRQRDGGARTASPEYQYGLARNVGVGVYGAASVIKDDAAVKATRNGALVAPTRMLESLAFHNAYHFGQIVFYGNFWVFGFRLLVVIPGKALYQDIF